MNEWTSEDAAVAAAAAARTTTKTSTSTVGWDPDSESRGHGFEPREVHYRTPRLHRKRRLGIRRRVTGVIERHILVLSG